MTAGIGVYYTTGNPFMVPPFRKWASKASVASSTVLEPFAGANHLVRHLSGMGLCGGSVSFDVAPGHASVRRRDTIKKFPAGFDVCVTNPPWFGKSSARKQGVNLPDMDYDDLYKHAIGLCLENCGWVAAVVPESFIRSGLFRDRLTDFVSHTGRLFDNTEHPVGLALFAPEPSKDVVVWRNRTRVGKMSVIEKMAPPRPYETEGVRFNVPDGNVGFIGVDNSRHASIRFCDPRELGDYPVKHSSRSITRIAFDGKPRLDAWNSWINQFRMDSGDVLLTNFKGLRRDGVYRRRMDFGLARGILTSV